MQETTYVYYERDEFIAALKDRVFSRVAKAVGVSHPTVSLLARGLDEKVSIPTKAKVTTYLMEG